MRRRRRPEDLTDRQREITELLMLGRSNKEMASALGISVNTVRQHVRQVLRIFNAASRLELIARELGRFRPPSGRL